MGVQERRARHKNLLRQEILDATRDILIREGYDGLSMRKVAERIDYSPTAIYLHFKDRDDLVFCVCEQFMAGLVRELLQVTEKQTDPLTALRKGLRRYVEYGLANGEQYQAAFMVPHAQDSASAERYQRPETAGMTAFDFLPRLVSEAMRQKQIGKVDVAAVSRALWAGVHGITSLLIVMPTFKWEDQGRVIDQLIDLLIGGIPKK